MKHILLLSLLLTLAYLLVGTLICALAVYVNLAGGGKWYVNGKWNDDYLPPTLIVLVWPLVVVVGAVWYLITGTFDFISYILTSAATAGAKREEKMRGFVKP